MPSSVKDRLANSYEHVFLFVKSRKYFFDLDVIRRPHTEAGLARSKRGVSGRQKWISGKGGQPPHPLSRERDNIRKAQFNKAGRLDGSIPKSASQEERASLLYPSGANPGDVIQTEQSYAVAVRSKEFVEVRDLPPLEEIREYLTLYRKKKGLSVEEVEARFGNRAPHHWFSGECYPQREDWIKLKDLLGFDDKFDSRLLTVTLKPAEKQNHPDGKNPGDVLDVSTRGFKGAHFAVFPEKLVEPLIKAGCPKNGLVLDCFAGSGTVGVVAQKLGRNAVLVEINPAYCELMRERLWKGCKPLPEGDG